MEFLRKDIKYSKRIDEIFSRRPNKLVGIGAILLLLLSIALIVFLKKITIEYSQPAKLIINTYHEKKSNDLKDIDLDEQKEIMLVGYDTLKSDHSLKAVKEILHAYHIVDSPSQGKSKGTKPSDSYIEIHVKGNHPHLINRGMKFKLAFDEFGTILKNNVELTVDSAVYNESEDMTIVDGKTSTALTSKARDFLFYNFPIKGSILIQKEGFYHYVFNK